MTMIIPPVLPPGGLRNGRLLQLQVIDGRLLLRAQEGGHLQAVNGRPLLAARPVAPGRLLLRRHLPLLLTGARHPAGLLAAANGLPARRSLQIRELTVS